MSRHALGDESAEGSYEEYLDSLVTAQDLYYLEDEAVARGLVELGYRGESITKAEFLSRRAERGKDAGKARGLYSAGLEISDPLLKAIAERESSLTSGRLTTILFLRTYNSRREEVSGYIDLAERLSSEDFRPYFTGNSPLVPRPTDLSFYNWDTNAWSGKSSQNLILIIKDQEEVEKGGSAGGGGGGRRRGAGICFKNKKDRKMIYVDPKGAVGDDSTRVSLRSPLHLQVVLFDHVTRRKA